jgi:uncharacterized protein YjdB
VASVSAQGGASALSGGKATITGTYLGQTGTAELTVTAAALNGLRVTPAMVSLKTGAMQAYKAEALYADGAVQDVTFRSTWASSSPAVATVSNGFSVNHGVATANAAGMANITATFMGFSAAGNLTVTE